MSAMARTTASGIRAGFSNSVRPRNSPEPARIVSRRTRITEIVGVPGVPPVTLGKVKLSATLRVAKSGNRNEGPPIPPLVRTLGR